MQTIGIDINLDVCKAEGYLMISFDARKKFNKNTQYHFTCYYPEYVDIIGLSIDTYLSLVDIWELYQYNKISIDESCDVNYTDITDITDQYSLLHLASDVNWHSGLNN